MAGSIANESITDEKHQDINQVENLPLPTALAVQDPFGFAQRPQEWHDEFRKKLVRKVDLRLLPMLCLMFLMCYLDRSNLAQARLAGLEEDLGLKGNEFNTATSVLFVGYLLMQLPSNVILTKVKPAVYLPLGT